VPSASHGDQVRTLSFRELAHNVARLTVQVPRLDSRPQLARYLFRLGEGLVAALDLRVGELALTMRRQVVTARPARRQLEPWPRPGPMNEDE
jgi:hypothetical protein